jgi:hypothetical protein
MTLFFAMGAIAMFALVLVAAVPALLLDLAILTLALCLRLSRREKA